MRDYEEKSYYEIQLDNKQLILVFLAAVTVCVLIFVLGVMIGKGQKEAEIAAATRVEKNTAAPEQDAAAPQQPLSDLASEANKNKKASPIPPEKQAKPTKTASAAVASEQTENKKPEKFAYEDLDKKDNEKEAPTKPAPTKSVPVAEPIPDTSAEVPSPDETPKSTGGTQYTVQIMATSSKPKAEQQLSSLKAKGFKAFLDETKNGNVSVYKVRVGKFSDTQEAKALASRIKKELRMEPWVAVLD